MPVDAESFKLATLAYFRTTGLEVPSHIKPDTLLSFLASEKIRWHSQAGIVAGLNTLIKKVEESCHPARQK